MSQSEARARLARSLILACFAMAGVLALVAWIDSDWTRVRDFATYGNMDRPNRSSFLSRLTTGLPDRAQGRVYRFDPEAPVHATPLIAVGLLYLLFFVLLYRTPERTLGLHRWAVQWAAFVVTRLGVLRVGGVSPVGRCSFGVWPFLNCQACEMATAGCPIGQLQMSLASRSFPSLTLFVLLATGAALGRWVCGWICPFGMLSDLADRLGRKSLPMRRSWFAGKYVVLVGLVLGALLAGSLGWHGMPFCSTFCASGKVFGHLPFYATHGLAPLIDTVTSPLSNPEGFACIVFHLAVALSLLGAMLLISGRFFCSVLCPVGGFLGLFNGRALVRVEHDGSSCVDCGACRSSCPMQIDLADRGFLTRSNCISCTRCVRVCRQGSRHLAYGLPPGPADWRGFSFGGMAQAMGWTGTEDEEGPRPAETMPALGPAAYGLSWRGRLTRRLLPWAALSPEAMARHAKESTPFYRRFYEGHDPANFADLPILHKSQVRDISPYELLSERYARKVRWYGETTGSTGSPTPSFMTPSEFAASTRMAVLNPATRSIIALRERNRTAVNGLAFGFTIAGQSFGDMLANMGCLVANLGSRSTLAVPERTARALARLRPSVIAATPIDFLSWMRIVEEDHGPAAPAMMKELGLFLSTAELCSRSRSLQIQRRFGCLHLNTYACVEGFFCVACPCGENHVLPIYHVELFDEALRPLGPYGRGRIAFSGLAKRSSPLLRYLLDDLVTVHRSDCPYGYEKSIRPHGRWELAVRLDENWLGIDDFEEILFRHALWGDYRVRIHDDGIRVRAEAFDPVDEGVVEKVCEDFETVFARPTTMEVLDFGTLTAYREVRRSKPILKVEDLRATSTQEVPEWL